MKKFIAFLLFSFALILNSTAQTPAYCKQQCVPLLKDYDYSAGQRTDWPTLAMWCMWTDPDNQFQCSQWPYNNPSIKSYHVTFYNADGSVYLDFDNYNFHSVNYFMYDDPNKIADRGYYYVLVPAIAGATYKCALRKNCADGTVVTMPSFTYTILGGTPPPAAPAQTTILKKKGK